MPVRMIFLLNLSFQAQEALRILHIDVPLSAKRQFQLFCSEHFPKPRWYYRLPRCRSGLDSPYLCVSSLPEIPSLVPKVLPSALAASVAVRSSSYSPIVTQVFYRTPMDQALATNFRPSLRNANERERAPQSRMRVSIGDALVLSQRD